MSLAFYAMFDGKRIGHELPVDTRYPSKARVIKWMFSILKLIASSNQKDPVADSGTKFIPGLAFTPDATTASGLSLPVYLRNKQAFHFAGKTGTSDKSGDIMIVRVAEFRLPDAVTVADNGTYYYPGALSRATWTDERHGIQKPNWRKIIRDGGNATTPMTGRRSTLDLYPGSMQVSFKRSTDKVVNQVSVAGFVSAIAPRTFSVAGHKAAIVAKARAKLGEKLYDLEHDAAIGESLAEYKQALSMLKRPLSGLHELLELYHERARRIALNALNQGRNGLTLSAPEIRKLNAAVANLYLEFTFGWKPLFLDLAAAIRACEDSRNRIKTAMSASYVGDAVNTDAETSRVLNSYCYFKVRVTETSRVTARILVGIDPVKVKALSYLERLGVLPSQFVPTVYAILPYSWIIDYFTGINAIVEALCADVRFVTWTCQTVREQSIVVGVASPDIAAAKAVTNGYIDSSGTPGVSRSVSTYVDRTIPDSLVPGLSISLPSSWKPYANLAALALSKRLSNAGAVFSAAFLNLLH